MDSEGVFYVKEKKTLSEREEMIVLCEDLREKLFDLGDEISFTIDDYLVFISHCEENDIIHCVDEIILKKMKKIIIDMQILQRHIGRDSIKAMNTFVENFVIHNKQKMSSN